jgi:hypothetical protein
MTDPSPIDTRPRPVGFFRGPFQKQIQPPRIVWVAFGLIVAGAADTLLGLLVTLAADVWSGYTSTSPVLIAPLIGVLTGLALRVYVAFAVLRGYEPARIFLCVVGVLVLIALIAGGFDPIACIAATAIIAAIILVLLPESHRYFREVTAARRAPSQLS